MPKFYVNKVDLKTKKKKKDGPSKRQSRQISMRQHVVSEIPTSN